MGGSVSPSSFLSTLDFLMAPLFLAGPPGAWALYIHMCTHVYTHSHMVLS